MPTPRPPCPAQFRQQMIELMQAGRTPAQLAREFDCSDQSSQYTGVAFGERCEKMGVRPSMGTVGDAYDNAMADSFFATLECELIDRRVWQTKTEARLSLFTYIEGWYHPRRRHSAPGLISPANYERKRNPTARTDQTLPALSEQT